MFAFSTVCARSLPFLGALLNILSYGLLAALFFLAFMSSASADEDPVLKEQIVVHEDLVTLGDIFENAGILQNIAVFQSPKIGTTGIISSARVALAAQRHGLIWTNPAGIDRIVVKRPSRNISLKEIKTLIINELKAKQGFENSENMDVVLANGSRPLNLDSRNKNPIIVISSQLNERNRLFRIVVGTESIDGNTPLATYSGRITQTTSVVMLNNIIERGSTITTGDIKTVKIPIERVNNQHIRKPQFIVGKAAKRQLSPNLLIRKNDVQVPKVIKANETVEIKFNIPGIALRTKGRAMEEGSQGQEITVMNMRSKRKIQAIVMGPGVVKVLPQVQDRTITSDQKVPITNRSPRAAYIVR